MQVCLSQSDPWACPKHIHCGGTCPEGGIWLQSLHWQSLNPPRPQHPSLGGKAHSGGHADGFKPEPGVLTRGCAQPHAPMWHNPTRHDGLVGGGRTLSPPPAAPTCPSREEMAFLCQPFSAELGKASLTPRARGSQHRTDPKGGNCNEPPNPQVVPSCISGKLPNPKGPISVPSSKGLAALTCRRAPCARGCPLSSGTSWQSAGKPLRDVVIGNPWGWFWEWGTPLADKGGSQGMGAAPGLRGALR